MSQAESSIQKSLFRLTMQLESIERKVEGNAANLENVREKVDLAMTSLSKVQEEQVSVAKQLKTVAGAHGAPVGDGIMGLAPSATTYSFVGMISVPPPPPPPHSDWIL
jgi:hypothetical protein